MKIKLYLVGILLSALLITVCKPVESAQECPECKNVFVASFQEGVLPSSGYTECYDAYIADGAPNNVYLNCTYLYLGQYSGSANRLALFFDVTAIPNDAVVVKAYLTLTTQTIANGISARAYAQSTYWWDSNSACNAAFSNAYEPHWNGPWSPAGGNLTQPASGIVTSSTSVRSMTFVLSNSIVQNWVKNGISSGTDGNFGVIIKSENEATGYLSFHTSSSTTPSLRPLLTVYYRLP